MTAIIIASAIAFCLGGAATAFAFLLASLVRPEPSPPVALDLDDPVQRRRWEHLP